MAKNILLNSAFIVALLISFGPFGCASTSTVKQMQPVPKETPAAVPLPKEEDKAVEKTKNAVSVKNEPPAFQELSVPDFKKHAEPKPLPKSEPLDPKKVLHVETPVILNVEAMPLSDFIIYALGDILKITFFIDEQVKNMKTPITLRMTQEMPAEKAFEIALGLFEKNELTVEERGGALYITKARIQHKKPVDIRIGREAPADSPAEIMQIVPFRYIPSSLFEGLIKDFFPANISVKHFPAENIMQLSGPASAIREIVDLVEIFDVPYMKDKKIFLMKLTYWQPDEFIKQITAILEGVGFGVSASRSGTGILFLPIKYLNNILVIAPDDASMKYVLDWHRKLDSPESAGAEQKAYTYNPKYSKASDLVDSLKNLMEGSAASAKNPPSVPSGAAVRSSLTIGNLRIASDDKRNIILIHSTPAEYKSVLTYLESLDVPPKQVLIEATIAELTLKDDLSYGLEWYLKNRMKEGGYTLSTLGKLGLSTASGLAYQFISDSQNFQAALSVFALENKINIISSPRLMVLDNEEAFIQIGTDVPTRTGSTTVAGGTSTSVESIQYRSTGLVLRVKPTINAEGTLTLTLSIESSDSQKNTMSAIDSPLILTRRINTMVAAATGQSIMLGGLISENKGETLSKIPLIGDIPLLGNLFKSTSKNKIKSELIILITPTIITSAENAARITNEFRQGLKWFR